MKYNDTLIILINIKQSQMLDMKNDNMVVDLIYEPVTNYVYDNIKRKIQS